MSVFAKFRNTLDYDGKVFRGLMLSEETADQVSKLSGVKKPTKADAAWRIPALPNNVEYLKKLGLAWTSPAQMQGLYLLTEALERLELSKRATSDLDFDGFGKAPDPYQKAGVEYMLRARRVLLADEMGLGKTLQALAFLYKHEDAFPALVISPLSLKDWWKQEGEACLPGRTFAVLNSKSKPLEIAMADVVSINHDLLADGWETIEKKDVKLTQIAQMLQEHPFKTIIADEAHWMKNPTAQRTKAALKLSEGRPNRIAITGTPVQNFPGELLPVLMFLGRLPDMGGYMYFNKAYCQGKNRYQPFHGSRNEIRLNRQLRSCCMIRRTVEDVKLELPPMRRSIVPVEIDNRAEYEFAERQLIEWVKKKAEEDQAFLVSIEHIPEGDARQAIIEQHKHSKAEKAKRAEAMIKISALKDVAARGKLKAALQWIDLYCESGKKLVVFAMHKVILDALKNHFPDAAYVTSDLDSSERTAQVKRFQEDASCQMLIGASGTNAGSSPAGTGLTMTAAEDSITLELGWNSALHDQMEKRVHRRGQTKPVTSYYLIGVDTIEKKILTLIDSKRVICEAITDGRVSSDIPPMVDLLMDELAKT